MHYSRIYIKGMACAALLALAACSSVDDEVVPVNPVTPTTPERTVPVVLSVPAHDVDTRLPGDPGYYEPFMKPRYAYIFMAYQTSGGQSFVTPLITPLDEDSWEKKIYAGSLAAAGDSIYTYTGDLSIKLPEDMVSAKIYAAMSYMPLTLSTTEPADETALLGITFDVSDDLQTHLQHVYSSPYNYNISGTYYGQVKDPTSAVPYVDDMLLYHVASRIDLIWNIPEALQPEMYLTGQITAKGLKKTGCLLFRPNENTAPTTASTAEAPAATADIYDLKVADVHPGNQWLGRQYYYAIPYKNATNNYDMKVRFTAVKTDDQTTSNGTLTVNHPYQYDIFTPWLRGDITFTSTTLTDKTI